MKNINIFSSVAEYENAKSRGVLITPNVSFVDEDNSVRYLLELDPYNGHEYVDLGLPSGLKWATCNVGATSPEQSGLYFAWGETTGYTADDVTSGVRAFTEDEYKAGPAASISTNLTLEHDAAHVNMGGKWRMPSTDEFRELLDNCNIVITDDYNETGVKGKVFTSKVNGKSVFFPTVGDCQDSLVNILGGYDGFYWSASWDSSDSAWYLDFSANGEYLKPFGTRYWGYSVRGVCK